MSQRALNTPEVEVSGSMSASTGVVTINIYNAGATQLTISGVKVYGPMARYSTAPGMALAPRSLPAVIMALLVSALVLSLVSHTQSLLH
ncbi:hypothetical protein [Vulcanisaeta distributa]|uniref:hypothetical protein n=1 Tax=Vulcanisaeta distributa TaxID=164451 RepID=UPI000A9A5EFB|nr:hypothetical protein [Vulcanisaeta distributa]